MKPLAIVRIYTRSWQGWLGIGLPLVLIVFSCIIQRSAQEASAIAVQVPLYLLVCYGLPICILTTGAGRRLMPGHGRATMIILLVLVCVGWAVAVPVAWSAGMPLAPAGAVAAMSVAFAWWFLVLLFQPWMLGLVMFGGILVSAFGRIIESWLLADPAAPWLCMGLAIIALVGGIRAMRSRRPPEQRLDATSLDEWSSFDRDQPAWLLAPGGTRLRRALQPWGPLPLALIGAGMVLALFALGHALGLFFADGTTHRMREEFAAMGAIFSLCGVALGVTMVAGRSQRLIGALLVVPGGGRRRIATGLVDAGMRSGFEILGCLAGAAAAAWALLDGLDPAWDGRTSWRLLAAVVVLSAATVAAAAPLSVWVMSWRLPGGLRWLQFVAWFAMMFAAAAVLVPTLHAWNAGGSAAPAIIVAFLALVVAAGARLLAIDRLARAQPV